MRKLPIVAAQVFALACSGDSPADVPQARTRCVSDAECLDAFAELRDCEAAVCSSEGRCVIGALPDGSACRDGLACTEPDYCLEGQCTGVTVRCVDNDPCTVDSCDNKSGCSFTPLDGEACDDLDPCTKGDRCVAGICQAGPHDVGCCRASAECDDDEPCTDDQCVAHVCQHPPNEVPCDDLDPCTTGDTCDGGRCHGGELAPGCCVDDRDCADADPCTEDHCNADRCAHPPSDAPCDDGDPCTSGDVCGGGRCLGAMSVPGCCTSDGDCADADPCSDDRCRANACEHSPNSLPCDDGDRCTTGDACSGGECRGGGLAPGCCLSAADCDDGNPCTDARCNDGSCEYPANAAPCDDADPCTTGDACAGAQCQGGALAPGCCHADEDCADADPCSDDRCVDNACAHPPLSAPCDPACFTCGDDSCLAAEARCDDTEDCAGGEDEEECALLVCLSGKPGTAVSGVQANTTWTVAGSPYRLTGDVLAAALTIEAGVSVCSDGPYVLEIAGDFQAVGTPDAPITFSGIGWHGLFFNGAPPGTRLTYCVVQGSSDSGIRITNTSPQIHNCLIQGNEAESGGGVRIDSGSPTLLNCRIHDNVATAFFRAGGGIYVGGGCPTITNCIISENQTVWANADGGGLLLCGGTTLVTNSTIVGNGGTTFGSGSGGIAVNTGGLSGCPDDARVAVDSSIVYNNAGYQITGSTNMLVVEYSDVQDGWPGTGNISGNPVFSDADYHLLEGVSPCIDSGDPEAARQDSCMPPSLGAAHNDMGAYGGPGACADGTGAPVCHELELLSVANTPAAPEGMSWDGGGLWMHDSQGNFSRLDTAGTVGDSFLRADLDNSWDLSWVVDGLWVADGNDGLVKVDFDGSTLDSLPGVSYWPPTGMEWDGFFFWVGDYNSGLIYKLDAGGVERASFFSDCYHPTGIVFDGTDLWIASDSGDFCKYSTSGTLLYRWSAYQLGMNLSGFISLAWDGADLWAADDRGAVIYQIQLPTVQR